MEKYEMISQYEAINYDLINICPICSSSIAPVEKSKFLNKESKMYFFTYECPACNKCFISFYNLTDNRKTYRGNIYNILEYINSYPRIPKKHEFDVKIVNLSSNFCNTYNQAYNVEQLDLDEIAGMGYRKSIEFLIKDYCVYKNPEDEEKIKGMLLAQVIKEYVEGSKIKNLAKASTWLGNDETHYIRKYEDKDIEDLKRFISATVAYITYELIADSAEEFVNS